MERYKFSQAEQTFLERLPSALVVYQFVETHIYVLALSQGYCDMFGFKDHAEAYSVVEKDVCYNTHPDDVARLANAIHKFVTESGHYEVIFRGRKYHEDAYHINHVTGKHVYTEDGTRLAYVWFTDEGAYIGEEDSQATATNRAFSRALHEESILKANYFDSLTGLPGMSRFFGTADKWKNAVVKEGGHPVMLYIDLKDMKFFNRDHGYSEGDRLLQAFAKLMSATFGAENCCRVGADHFAAFMLDQDVEDAVERFLSQAAELNNGVSLPVKVGVYRNAMGDVPASTACDRAKLACNALSKTTVSGYCCYNEEMRKNLLNRQYIITHFDRAIKEKWIQVYYQPIVRAANMQVCDEEALSRWIDPERGFLSPGDFIPTLEDAGLIYRLDLYVLEQVLEKIKLQKELGITVIPQSINLSRSDFDACDIVEEIRRRVDEAGVDRDRITIEITESVIGRDFDFIKEQIQRFKALGFPVWMDDFGSGYSSLDVLQSIKFDLLKFDMGFMRKLHEGDEGKVILAELMKLASALGVDTICEGVETAEQSVFLQEIGCSKLQGFYFCKPIPMSEILERFRSGKQIEYENPTESAYYEAVGRVNLYDLAVIAPDDDDAFHNAFNTLPIGIIEVRDDKTRFVRSNQSYRDFVKRFFGYSLSNLGTGFVKYDASFMYNVVKTCCEQGTRAFYDEMMPDGSVVHSFARRISTNPVNGTVAVAIAVLSITDADEGATYAGIARALASDYYNIYYINLDTDKFIEYSSPIGGEGMAMERHGERFFEAVREDSHRIYENDREFVLNIFKKENIIRQLEKRGAFTISYRLMDTGEPMYVSLKVTRMPGGNHIIVGISPMETQIKQKRQLEEIRRERDALSRIAALSEDYLSLFSIDPETGSYIEYSTSPEFEALGKAKEGENFFEAGIIDAKDVLYPEDLPRYLEKFTKENILKEIEENGVFIVRYRLMLESGPTPVSLRIARVREGDGVKLIAGVRISL